MRTLEELLADYKSGLLSPEEEQFLAKKLKDNPELQKEAEGYAAAWEVVRHKVNIDTKEQLKAQLMADEELRERYEGKLKRQLENEPKILEVHKEKKIVPPPEETPRFNWAISLAATIALIFLVYFGSSVFLNSEISRDLFTESQLLDQPPPENFWDGLNNSRVVKNQLDNSRKDLISIDSTLRSLAANKSYREFIIFSQQVLKDTVAKHFIDPDFFLQLAISHYHIYQFEEASLYLENIEDPESNEIEDYYLWYKGRIGLQLDQDKMATEALCRLSKIYENFRPKEVSELLKRNGIDCL